MKVLPVNTAHYANRLYNTKSYPFGTQVFCGKIKPDEFVKSKDVGLKDVQIVGKRFKDKIKIVFSDIDGTISEKNDYVSYQTASALDRLYSHNIPVILTTGRCYKDTIPILEQFKHNPDYTIVLQGGSIIDKNGKAIIENNISKEGAQRLNNWFREEFSNDKNSHLIIYFDDQTYCESNIQFPWKARSLIIPVKSFSEILDKGLDMQKAILYKTDGYKSDFEKIVNSFRSCGIEDMEILQTGQKFYEFQNKNATKDKAIKYILSELDINPKNAMAIGDSANDIEMLDFINNEGGLAIAMGNASKDVKNFANAITSDINQDGYVKAIDSFL